MGGLLKFLIGVACVAVIVGAAWFAWGEWNKFSARSAATAEIETAWNAIYNESKAERGDLATARGWCEGAKALAKGSLKDNPVAQLRAQQCLLVGL